jgi:membrane protein required for beta-lactamase induction
MKRREGESYEDYKARRAADNKRRDDTLHRGFVVHQGGTYNKAEEAKKKLIRLGFQAHIAIVFQFIVTPDRLPFSGGEATAELERVEREKGEAV